MPGGRAARQMETPWPASEQGPATVRGRPGSYSRAGNDECDRCCRQVKQKPAWLPLDLAARSAMASLMTVSGKWRSKRLPGLVSGENRGRGLIRSDYGCLEESGCQRGREKGGRCLGRGLEVRAVTDGAAVLWGQGALRVCFLSLKRAESFGLLRGLAGQQRTSGFSSGSPCLRFSLGRSHFAGLVRGLLLLPLEHRSVRPRLPNGLVPCYQATFRPSSRGRPGSDHICSAPAGLIACSEPV